MNNNINIDLSICIVSMNHKNVLKNCIDSIYRNSPKKYTFEIIVVDNKSNDGTIDILKKYKVKYENFKYILNKKIKNFSQNNNIAIKNSKGKFVLILNPDTVIFDGTLDYMIDFLKDRNDVGAATCKLIYPDGTFQENARKFIKFKYLFASRMKTWGIFYFKKLYNEYIMVNESDTEIKEVDYIIGAAMFIRREVFDEIGYFDERFLLYAEDTDLCFRIKNAGWKILYVPNVSIIHIYARTGAKKIFSKNFILQIYTAILFYLKNYLKILK